MARKAEADDERERLVATVQQASVNFGVATEAVPALERAVDAAKANAAQADARFNAGLGNAVELADAEGLRVEAEIQLTLGQFEAGAGARTSGPRDRGGTLTDAGSQSSKETIKALGADARSRKIPIAIGAGVVGLLLAGGALFLHARGSTNKVALASEPKGVTATKAAAAEYREHRRYVGTLEPWVAASVGPQLVSAYIDTVLVRPGAVVKRGEVLATLDCRNATR